MVHGVPTPFVQKYTVRPFACQSSPTPRSGWARDAARANLRVENRPGTSPRLTWRIRRRWHRHCRCCASGGRCAAGARRGAGGGPRAAGGRFESDHRRGDVAIITTPGRNPRKHWSDPVYRRTVIGRGPSRQSNSVRAWMQLSGSASPSAGLTSARGAGPGGITQEPGFSPRINLTDRP